MSRAKLLNRNAVVCLTMIGLAAATSSLEFNAAHAQVVDCSITFCTSADQQTIIGYPMFDESNFAAVVDGFGVTRSFWVHIPDDYDAVDGVTQKIPLIFAFHGGGQTREAMVAGKWADYFDDNVAFVIPLGEADPCANNQGTQWMQPTFGANTTPTDINCDPGTQVVDSFGDTITYWNASLPGTFTDVLFVEQLRSMILSRFPKLNADKVYATGFSSGGGMTLSLLCYRANLFRGFSVVAKLLAGAAPRGDYTWDGVNQTDPDSLVATCGKSQWDPDRATGLTTPRLWGYDLIPLILPGPSLPVRVTKPIALFAGDQDARPVKIAAFGSPKVWDEESPAQVMQNINDTGAFIRTRNNLTGGFFVQNPFLDTVADRATTQRRTFSTASNVAQPYSIFRRFLVQGVANESGTHAMPDAQECAPPYNDYFSTCDYDYTAQTLIFFEDHADLNLNP